ncbi:MAG: protein translocase subunit SecD [Propionibacteriaceae bacterium]|nr:protein translocase subunit SecD [Propionibacteriaceae bacterium]
MPKATTRRRRPGMTILGLFIVLGLMIAIMAFSQTWTPKLGLDLSGGTTINLTVRSSGSGGVNQDNLNQARTIIEQRVNSLGVGEVSVTTSGNNQITVTAPNVQGDVLTEMVGQTARLEFRRVHLQDWTAAYDELQATEFPTAPTPETEDNNTDTKAEDNPEASGEEPEDTPLEQLAKLSESERVEFLKADMAWNYKDSALDYEQYFQDFECGSPPPEELPTGPDAPLIACARDSKPGDPTAKYLLGPMIIEGTLVKRADAAIPDNEISWIVRLEFDGLGSTLFREATAILSAENTQPMNQFAIVLDGQVISAPKVENTIPNGSAQISGDFTQSSANNLANVLKYGALPLEFDVGEAESVSATLGKDQLFAGLIAGGIGLLLVIGFCLLYYRGLTVVVVASLVMAGIAVYSLLCLLGGSIGMAVSLPGLAGVIVAIGITADSFVIFFERVRDEAREGKSIRTAVETGWERARRTIVIADSVTILSAVVLFILSIGAVKGFAFALGMTTLVDLGLIFFFTKPLMSLLVRTKFFGQGKKWSGFEASRLGVESTKRSRLGARQIVKEG